MEHLSGCPGSPIESYMLIHGMYANQLDKFFKLFSREQLLIVESEGLRSNTV